MNNKTEDAPAHQPSGFDDPDLSSEETLGRNETLVEEGFLLKLRKVLGKLPFAEELGAAYYCAMDNETPTRVRGILMAALAYFVMPVDMIPDFVTGFGFADDATVVTTAIAIVSGHIKDVHYQKARSLLLKETATQETGSPKPDPSKTDTE